MTSTIVILGTGGTIAGRSGSAQDNVAYRAGSVGVDELVAAVPPLAALAQAGRLQHEQVANVDSKDMDHALWQALARAAARHLARPEVAGVVVTHGTDTLEETAWFLDLTVQNEKPIVLIGAQRNASEKDFDGPRNLLNAARVCVTSEARGKGAMIVLNNQINAAREVTKTHTSDVETFKSGDFGFLGVADNDRVIFSRAPTRRQHVPLKAMKEGEKLPAVEIVAMYGGADGKLVRSAVANGAKGLVIQGLGWGNVNVPMYEAIQEVLAKGIPVVVSTRVPNGRVLPVYGFKGGGKTLQEAGAVMADNLPPQKARILLMLAMQTTSKQADLQKLFDR